MKHFRLLSLQNEKTLISLTTVVFLIAAYLATINLDYAPLWDDEAASAIIAKNLAERGEVSVWDGRNLMDYYDNVDSVDKDLVPRHPKLHYYLIAASYKIFGVADWSARLPGAIAGLAALLLFALLLRLEFPDRPGLRLLAFTLLALSPAYLLIIRQSHYYAATVLFNLLVFYFYRLHLERRHPALLFFAAAAAIAAFYTHYLLATAFAAALLIWHLLFFLRAYNRQDWVYAAAAAGVFMAFVVAYMWVTGYYTGAGRTNIHDPYALRVVKLLWLNFKALSENSFAPWPVWLFFTVTPLIPIPLLTKKEQEKLRFKLESVKKKIRKNKYLKRISAAVDWPVIRPFFAAIPLISILLLAREEKQNRQNQQNIERKYIRLIDMAADLPAIRAGVFVLLFGAWIAAGSIQPTHNAIWADVRYLNPILPFCAVFCAGFVAALARWQKWLGGIFLIPLMFSNYLSYPLTSSGWYQRTPQMILPALVAELHSEHRSGYSETAAFLRAHAADGDKILIHPSYHNMPLMFYFSDRLLFCCHVKNESPLQQTAAALAPHVLREENFPDWLIFFSQAGINQHVEYFSRPTDGVCQRQYVQVEDLRAHYHPTQRPEIILHRWTPVKKENVSPSNSVLVYRLQSQNCGDSPS